MNDLTGPFLEFVHAQLEILDASLTAANQPVHNRPWFAAMQFVQECMVSIGDEPIGDDYLEQDWFGDVLLATTRWYRSRYGSDLLESPRENILGVVAAFGMPLKLAIPRVSQFDTDKVAVKRLVFADGVLDEEDSMTWTSPRPNLDGLKGGVAQQLRDDVLRTSTSLRQIHRRLLFADITTTEGRELASSIEGHLEKAAADIHSARYSAAIWEVHLCVEKTIKVFLQQRKGSFPHSHDLAVLVAEAETAGLPSCAHLNLRAMPPHGDAIRHRYAELPAPSFESMMGIYDAALRVTAHVAKDLKPGEFTSSLTDLHIRALPWHPKWKEARAVDESA